MRKPSPACKVSVRLARRSSSRRSRRGCSRLPHPDGCASPNSTPAGISVRTWMISRPGIEDGPCWISVRFSLPASSSMGGSASTSGRRADCRRLPQEGQQLAVDLLGVGDAHDMWSALDLDVPRVRQRRVQAPALALDRQDPVRCPVQDQRRDVDALDVLVEVIEPREDARPGRERRRPGTSVPVCCGRSPR